MIAAMRMMILVFAIFFECFVDHVFDLIPCRAFIGISIVVKIARYYRALSERQGFVCLSCVVFRSPCFDIAFRILLLKSKQIREEILFTSKLSVVLFVNLFDYLTYGFFVYFLFHGECVGREGFEPPTNRL